MQTVVAILNWNGLSWLQKFLPDVVRYSPEAAVAVIDNASTDESLAWIKSHHPEVQIIQLDRNYGFAGGYNKGLEKLEAENFVLLNSDVAVTPGWLAPMLLAMEGNGWDALQPKILSFQQKDTFEYAGAAGGFIDRDGFVFCRGRMFNHFEKDEGQYNKASEVFWASGAALLVKALSYREAGGLDEDFFAHMEEIDLCWRLKNKGKRIGYCPDSVVYHVGGGTLSKINPRKTYLNFRNNLYLLVKNYHGGNLGVKLFWRMFLDGLAAFKFLFEGQFRHFFAVFRAHMSLYANLAKFLKKRKSLAPGIKINRHSGYYKRSVVWQYFLKGKKHFLNLHPDDFTAFGK